MDAPARARRARTGDSTCRADTSTLYVEDYAFDPGAVRREGFDDCVGDRLELVSTKTRGHQDDAGVPGIRRDGFVSQLDEIDDIRGHDRAAFASRVFELGTVGQLGIAHILGAGGVHSAPAKECGDVRREILVEVHLHRVRRTRPGYRFSIPSGVSVALASILAWTSSR